MAATTDQAAGSARPGEGLLAGVRVIELGPRLAGPLLGVMLAEQGAEVVRILDPQRPAAEPLLEAVLARGKGELPLDPTGSVDRAALGRLLVGADVLIDGLAPGELVARWGLDPTGLRQQANPGLICCSLPAFVAGDPRASLPDQEALAGAAGLLYDRPLGQPRPHDFPVGSVLAALFGACGVLAALISRLGDGQGQQVDSCRHHASLFAQMLQLLLVTGVPRGFLAFKMVSTPFMRSWRCADGRYVYLHVTLPAHNAELLRRLAQLGHGPEVAALRAALSPETQRDPSQVRSIAEAKQLRRIYGGVFASRTADEWERLLGRELCCIKVRTVAEWLADSLAAGMSDACVVPDPRFGELVCPGPAAVVAEEPPRLRPRAPVVGGVPGLLARWSPRSAPAAPLTAAGAPGAASAPLRPPLDGVRVLDLSRVIAGPCAARVLAELGAEVISVQNPGGLDWALSFHLLFNGGKRSVVLDTTTDAGKATFGALLDDFRPQVLLQNYRNLDVARAVGVGPEQIRARLPEVVYTHLNAYGNEGSWRDRPGFEQVVQAVSGIQLGYAHGGPPKLLPTPVIDIGSGLLGAFASLLGIYRQRSQGLGCLASTHLTRLAVLLQAEQVAAGQRPLLRGGVSAGSAPVGEGTGTGGGTAAPPAPPLVRRVRTLDGPAWLVGPPALVRRWLRGCGPLWTRPLAHWQRTLRRTGLAEQVTLLPVVALPRLLAELARLEPPGGVPLVRRRPYPGVSRPLVFVRSPLRLSRTPLVDVDPSHERGADTAAVLGRLGAPLPGAGRIGYPPDKPWLVWLGSALRWGYFAWRSGNL